MEARKGILYLFPTPISEDDCTRQLPSYNMELLKDISHFVVEDIRSARRFISRLRSGLVIDDLLFSLLNEHTPETEIEELLKPLIEGKDVALMSEAGLPAVADPGSSLVAAAHRHGIAVVPLVGPSSILMALMASGLNGQSFAFNGYLPVKGDERSKRIRDLARRAASEGQSQIFIETPYRNEALFAAFLDELPPSIRLTVAIDLASPEEYISTRTIDEWRRAPIPDMKKRCAIFIFG